MKKIDTALANAGVGVANQSIHPSLLPHDPFGRAVDTVLFSPHSKAFGAVFSAEGHPEADHNLARRWWIAPMRSLPEGVADAPRRQRLDDLRVHVHSRIVPSEPRRDKWS